MSSSKGRLKRLREVSNKSDTPTRPENPAGAVHGKAQSVLHLLKQQGVHW